MWLYHSDGPLCGCATLNVPAAAAAAAAAAATCDAIDEPIKVSNFRESAATAAAAAAAANGVVASVPVAPIKFSNLRVSGLYIGCLNLQCVRKLSLLV